jgi:hypothetical protein
MPVEPLDFRQLRVYPLAQRQSLSRVENLLVDPDSPAAPIDSKNAEQIRNCAASIRSARQRGAAVILIYGAHLLRNGATKILTRLMEQGLITHLATNGAGTIHDWEYAWFGASTESVEMGVAGGHFGTWHETASTIHLALMAGALDSLGYGQSLGRFIHEDGTTLPKLDELRELIRQMPDHPLTGARFDLLQAMQSQNWPAGHYALSHQWKEASILANAWRCGVPVTVHPGIGYDIISNHQVFSGSVIGRAAERDFKLIGGSVNQLDGGVLLSVGSAIMGPQVFEKSLSCVNNIRQGQGRQIVSGHKIYVVDLQDGGGWDWTQGEPPKSHPAYYLRFCKSYSRMGAPMHYLQCDNLAFVHHLYHTLSGDFSGAEPEQRR